MKQEAERTPLKVSSLRIDKINQKNNLIMNPKKHWLLLTQLDTTTCSSYIPEAALGSSQMQAAVAHYGAAQTPEKEDSSTEMGSI